MNLVVIPENKLEKFLQTNLFVGAELMEKLRKASAGVQAQALPILRKMAEVQERLLDRIVGKNPHFFDDLERNLSKAQLQTLLQRESKEHAAEIADLEAEFDQIMSE